MENEITAKQIAKDFWTIENLTPLQQAAGT